VSQSNEGMSEHHATYQDWFFLRGIVYKVSFLNQPWCSLQASAADTGIVQRVDILGSTKHASLLHSTQ
jgi:hypothetical protein